MTSWLDDLSNSQQTVRVSGQSAIARRSDIERKRLTSKRQGGPSGREALAVDEPPQLPDYKWLHHISNPMVGSAVRNRWPRGSYGNSTDAYSGVHTQGVGTHPVVNSVGDSGGYRLRTCQFALSLAAEVPDRELIQVRDLPEYVRKIIDPLWLAYIGMGQAGDPRFLGLDGLCNLIVHGLQADGYPVQEALWPQPKGRRTPVIYQLALRWSDEWVPARTPTRPARRPMGPRVSVNSHRVE